MFNYISLICAYGGRQIFVCLQFVNKYVRLENNLNIIFILCNELIMLPVLSNGKVSVILKQLMSLLVKNVLIDCNRRFEAKQSPLLINDI